MDDAVEEGQEEAAAASGAQPVPPCVVMLPEVTFPSTDASLSVVMLLLALVLIQGVASGSASNVPSYLQCIPSLFQINWTPVLMIPLIVYLNSDLFTDRALQIGKRGADEVEVSQMLNGVVCAGIGSQVYS